MIEYRSVYKAFDTPVLSGVDLTISTGETLAIVGPSGTGKSVLLKTTIGLITPDAGDVRVDGDSAFFSGPRALQTIRRKVGYVFQNAALFDSMTVFENVSQGLPEGDLRKVKRRELVRRVGEALELVNLEPRVVMSKLPSELSGGMRKRVGLARAIVGKPQILLYDEPVTGLDPVNGAIVHRLIARLADELDVTSVIVTHEIHGALGIADRIALLEGGRIRFVGTTSEFRESDNPLVRAFLEHGDTGNMANESLLEAGI
ncbi:MAG TPA: ATP-binding cassette domain-containing protein [Longimicrobiaceae bacterium]|nr:ATP-binding cassette domain-containing protein [Longimicrobiaceae bacterium]